MSAHLPVLQVVLPLFAALLAALFRNGRLAWLIALAASLASLAVALLLMRQVLAAGTVSYAIGGWPPELGIEYRVDLLAAFVLVIVAAAAAVLMPYARRSAAAEIDPDRLAWFYSLYLLCLTGLLGIAITGDAFNAFVFLEISSLATYALIALGRDRRALLAAYRYLIAGTIGATFYVIGVGFLYVMTGTLNLGLLAERLPAVETARPVLVGLAFIVTGISLKLALFPLHGWLPAAYAHAPVAATAFIAASATKVALYLLARFLYGVFDPGFVFGMLPARALLVLLSLAAIFAASTLAVLQRDLRRMLAYSSVGQVGYITLGLALANQPGLAGGIVHLANHALAKAALFMAAGAMTLRSGAATLDGLAGIGRRMKLTMAVFVIAGASLIGVPGTAGFVSKWYLLAGALEAGSAPLAFLVVAGSLPALLYVGRFVEIAWLREPAPAVAAAREAPADMLAPMLLLAAATVFLGLDTAWTAGIAERIAALLLAPRP